MAVPVMPQILSYSLKKFCSVIVARSAFSSLTRTPSLASTAWCSPSLHCRPGIMRPVNSSTMITSSPCDDVIHVALVEVMGLERVVDQVRPVHVAGRVEALDAGQLFGLAHALVGQMHGVLFFLDLEVHVLLQLPGDLVGLGVARDVVVRRAGDDQRRAGFVDQNVVDLVDDRVVQFALALLRLLG